MKTKEKTAVSTQIVFESVKKRAVPIIKRLELVEKIGGAAEMEKVLTDLKVLKAIAKEAEAQLDSIVAPAKTIINNAKGIWSPFLLRIKTLEADKKANVLDYKAAKDRESMKVLKDFEDGKIKRTSTVIAKQTELAVSSEVASFRKLTRAKCLDEKATPREYLLPDEQAILDALRAGKKVKGWELELVDSIAI